MIIQLFFLLVITKLTLSTNYVIKVNKTGDAVIKLKTIDKLVYINSLPKFGKIYQLSHVYSNYGYQPIKGTLISNSNTLVTGSNNRIYYKYNNYNLVDTFHYNLDMITVVPYDGIIVKSDFLLNNDGWKIVGHYNKGSTYMPYNDRYIVGHDDLININKYGENDNSLWYFEAPEKYYGDLSIAYDGTIEFTLVSYAGNFNNKNTNGNLIELWCEKCKMKLYYPLINFDGKIKNFILILNENRGWYLENDKLTKEKMIYLLKNISKIRILGDWTQWYETIGLDNVLIKIK